MPALDLSSDISKLRLRVGDWRDPVILPDEVYQDALDQNNDNLNRSAILCAQYILATLSFGTRSKFQYIESYDNQAFDQYRKFLLDTVNNPAFMTYNPIAYGGDTSETNPLIQFAKSWNAGYTNGTAAEEMDAFYEMQTTTGVTTE